MTDKEMGALAAGDGRLIRPWLMILSGLLILLFAAEAYLEIAFPWFVHNEPWQGLHIPAAARILQGLPLYPDIYQQESFYAYSPLLPWVHALFLKVFGVSVVSVKLSALLGCLAAVGGIYYLSYLLSGDRWIGLLPIAYYLAFFEEMQFWHLSVRPDNIAAACVLWAVIIAYRCQERFRIQGMIIAAVLLAAAALFKQTFGIMGVVFFAYYFLTARRREAALGMAVWGLLGVAVVAYYSSGDEHFLSVLKMMGEHEVNAPWDTLKSAKVFLLLQVFPLVLVFLNFRRLGLLGPMVLGALLMGLIGLSKWGGAQNGFLTLILLSGPVIAWAYRHYAREGQSTQILSVGLALLISLSAVSSIGRLANWQENNPDYLSQVAQFIGDNRDKRIYFPMRNYMTYIKADQYYHCDWMSENIIRADSKPPQVFLDQIAGRRFDYIIGDFSMPAMNYYRDRFYSRVPSRGVGGFGLYIPK